MIEAPAKGAAAAQSESAAFDEGMVIDLSNVDPEAGGFAVMPRGMYNCVVDDLTFGPSQRSGNPMWTWTFEVEGGDYAGRKLWFYSPFTEDMKPRITKVLSRIAPELLSGPFSPGDIAAQGTLVGKRAKLRVDIRKYEGKDRNNVRDILPPEQADGGDFLAS